MAETMERSGGEVGRAGLGILMFAGSVVFVVEAGVAWALLASSTADRAAFDATSVRLFLTASFTISEINFSWSAEKSVSFCVAELMLVCSGLATLLASVEFLELAVLALVEARTLRLCAAVFVLGIIEFV